MGYLTAYFDGRKLPVKITKVNRNVTPEISNKLREIESVSGAEFAYSKYKEKSITIEYVISNQTARQLSDFRRSAAGLIYSEEPKKLIFSDEPNLYYEAILSGEAKLDENYLQSTGTLTFVVPDGLAHSTVEKVFPASPNANGIMEALIVNEGTDSVPVSYEITHNHENGYIGIVSEYGVMQYGRVEEADGEHYKQNEMLARLTSFQSLPDDTGRNHMHPDHAMNGKLITDTSGGRLHMHLQSVGNITRGRWNGGMKTLVLPADSEGNYGARNFYCYLNHWFETGLMGQTAEQSVAFLTADNRLICGYSIYKADMTGNTACLEYWANGKVLKSITFVPTGSDYENPFNNGRGHNDIRKEGDQVTFYWWGSYLSYTIPEIKNMECHKIQISFTQYDMRNLGNQYVTRNDLRAINFEKMNVEKWRNVPNRYPEGSTVLIDGKETKVYVNGMANTGDEMVGTSYFHVPSGDTKVEFYYSSFCDPPPAITAKIREAYL